MKAIPDYVIQALERMQREAEEREEAAFQRGWDGATHAFNEAVAKARGPLADLNAVRSDGELEGSALVRELMAATTNRERVAAALKLRPGMRPVEVYGYLAQMGLDVNRDSILTTIKRMRSDNELHNEGEGLHLTIQK